jgi:hypothetical protein
MALAATPQSIPERFIVLRDERPISITFDRRKAEQIARHFKRLQPAATVQVRDLAAEAADKR